MSLVDAGIALAAMLAAGALWLACGPTYTPEDSTANAIGRRHTLRLLDLCAPGSEDAGTCTPAAVRAHALIVYCANARELAVHAELPEGGPPCPRPQP